MPETKKYFGMSKEELVENLIIAGIMAGVSFAVAFVGFGVKSYVQTKIQLE